MTGVESVVPPQPVVKDVQTLKANLKEQEKRARSEPEVQELVADAARKPAEEEEQRKRRRVSGPAEPTEAPEVLDGPLPAPELVKPDLPSPVKTVDCPAAKQQDSAHPAADSGSPTKVPAPTEASDAPEPAADPILHEITNVQPPPAPTSSESPKKLGAANNESATNDQTKIVAEVKEKAADVSAVKALGTAAEPVMVEAAAAS